METRQRILAAALDVYGQGGFRGATTRRIAALAGVNEVTVFRLFGSKQALLAEALRSPSAIGPNPLLPAAPTNPGAELYAWTETHLRFLTTRSQLLRASMGDVTERPALVDGVVAWQTAAFSALLEYLKRLDERGFVQASVDLTAAAAMLTAAVFSDAAGIHPERDEPPVEDRAKAYAALVLSALGVTGARTGVGRAVRASPPPTVPDATGA